ncbi:hypothetical protein K435DRAFT_785878 [Dendrothele bispora CBS 962.96]|uniref:Uncharacterized protein n=1 Tax=Dendrothele bispora (strain CBS 962.96) TaxID=1314807 RepID=A0A4S8KU42_DENBC|nr:hypothetical protein K435DRAFT_785878 [Dendrothele bispora CBS 962.96]
MLDTLCFSATCRKRFPLITILNFLASLHPHPGMLPDVQRNQIRVFKLWDISDFEDCRDISPVRLAGLEILHIYSQNSEDENTVVEGIALEAQSRGRPS